MPKKIGLLFDKDGTLFEFQKTWSAWTAELIRELSNDTLSSMELAEALGFDLQRLAFHRDSPIIAGNPDELLDVLARAFPHMERKALLARILDSAMDAPLAEATPLAPLLDRLRAAGCILGVATNDGEVPARAHLKRTGILEQFAFIAGYDSGHGAKPDPGMMMAFMEQNALSPQNAAMIGDSTHDLRAGRAAGMATIGVLTGTANRFDLEPFADVVLPSIAQLPDWLGIV